MISHSDLHIYTFFNTCIINNKSKLIEIYKAILNFLNSVKKYLTDPTVHRPHPITEITIKLEELYNIYRLLQIINIQDSLKR